jgi:hypothetical protein
MTVRRKVAAASEVSRGVSPRLADVFVSEM